MRDLIAEAYNESRELGLFVELAAVTGARPSQIVRLEVRDLQDGCEPRLMMPASRKGKGKKARSHYPVPISADLAERLAAPDRPANAPLVTRPNGKPWKRTNHAYPFRLVAKACGQDPAEATMYALRHSSIVRQLLAGVPVRIVAAGHDTSVAMIERNYSRYITDHADALVRGAMLNLTPRDQPKLAVVGNPLFKVAGLRADHGPDHRLHQGAPDVSRRNLPIPGEPCTWWRRSSRRGSRIREALRPPLDLFG